MLIFLTGEIQTGKTRWLERAVDELERTGANVCGVIAPGRWIERDGAYEKVGIDNVLLPKGERVAFAEPGNPGWKFNERAIEHVNKYLRDLRNAIDEDAHALLVIDEIGWLELNEGRGLTAALDVLDVGADDTISHALVVVRESLLQCAMERFARANWGEICVLRPA